MVGFRHLFISRWQMNRENSVLMEFGKGYDDLPSGRILVSRLPVHCVLSDQAKFNLLHPVMHQVWYGGI